MVFGWKVKGLGLGIQQYGVGSNSMSGIEWLSDWVFICMFSADVLRAYSFYMYIGGLQMLCDDDDDDDRERNESSRIVVA